VNLFDAASVAHEKLIATFYSRFTSIHVKCLLGDMRQTIPLFTRDNFCNFTRTRFDDLRIPSGNKQRDVVAVEQDLIKLGCPLSIGSNLVPAIMGQGSDMGRGKKCD
jgi:hypothetical protein